MSSRCPERPRARLVALLLAAVSAAALAVVPGSGRAPLRVCADPDNRPFSSEDRTGFENRIAVLVARALGADVRYYWWPQRRGFVRNTLNAGVCDVIVGVPVGFERTLNTRPYYRSTYMLVEPAGDRTPPAGFDDPRLKQWRVGVQLIGDDFTTTPPALALAQAGAVDNVQGYAIPGDEPAAARIVHALARGELDAAFVWGPQAGYYAAHAARPLQLHYVPPPDTLKEQPFGFAIAMGVKRGNQALRDRLDDFIVRRQADIDRILADYGVPRVQERSP